MKLAESMNLGEGHLDTSLDNVIIRNPTDGIDGGVSLVIDSDLFPFPQISAGHVVLFDEAEQFYHPHPVVANGDGTYSYASLPQLSVVAGIVRSSRVVRRPELEGDVSITNVPVMTQGSVNAKAVLIPYTPEQWPGLAELGITRYQNHL